jgi:hypothetical protein
MQSHRSRLLTRLPAFAVAVASLAAVAAPAIAADTYYVSPSGNVNNPGTIGQPFLTIQQGEAALNEPGDTLFIRAGSYHERVNFNVAGAVISGYQNEVATIDGQGTLPGGTNPKYDYLVRVSGDDIVFSKLSIKNSAGRGLSISGAELDKVTGVVVDNVKVSETYDAGIHIQYAFDATVQNCDVTHAVKSELVNDSPHAVALVAVDSDFTTIRKCNVHENYGENIGDLRSTYTTIEDNVSWDSAYIMIYLDNSQFSTVQRNIVYSTDNVTFWRYDNESPQRPSPGIVANSEDYSEQKCSTGQLIVNNFVYNTGSAMNVWTPQAGSGCDYTNSTIAYNTLVSTRTQNVSASFRAVQILPAGAVGNAFKNNIIKQAAGTIATGDTTGWSRSNNNWPGTAPSGFGGTNDVSGDPQLTLGTGSPNEDFLRINSASSPAIGHAQVLTAITEDFFQEPRNDGSPDIGAHEFSESPPPPPSSNMLSNPGFEATTSWTNYPITGYAEQNTSSPHSGTYHLKLRNDGAGYVDVYQTVSVTAGQVYKASVWQHTFSPDGLSRGQMRLQWYQGATPIGSPIDVNATVAAYAQLQSGDITAPAGATNLRMTLRPQVAISGSNYYFDDAAIVATNLLANPGFEATTSWTNYPIANYTEQNTSSPHSGTYHLKLRDGGTGFVEVYQTVGVTPGQVYQASVWQHTFSPDGLSRGQMSLQWYQGAAAIGSPINVNATVAAYAKLTSGNITAPAGATHLRMTLRPQVAIAGSNYYFDDAEIK